MTLTMTLFTTEPLILAALNFGIKVHRIILAFFSAWTNKVLLKYIFAISYFREVTDVAEFVK